MRRTSRQAVVLGSLLFVTLAAQGFARETTFAANGRVSGTPLTLYGIGRLSRWMITGCDIALYLPAGVKGAEALEDVAKRLHFHYYRSIKGSQFANGALHTLEQAFADDQLTRDIRQGVESLHAAYRDVARGDEYTLTYVPGEGTALALNGEELVRIPGAEFARIYFAVWLGDPPIDERLKAGLLRRRDLSDVRPGQEVGFSK